MNRLAMRGTQLGLLGLACILAGDLGAKVFADGNVRAKIVFVALIAVVPPAAGIVRWLPVVVTSGLSLVLFALYADVAVLHGSPIVFHGLGALVHVGDGWNAIVGVPVPARADGTAVLFVLAVVWLAALLIAELAVRTRAPATPLVPVVAELIVVRVLVAGYASSLRTIALVAILCFAALALRAEVLRGSNLSAGARRLTTAVIVLAVAFAVGDGAASSAPFADRRRPYDPRTSRSSPNDHADTVSPLVLVKAWLTAPTNEDLFDVRYSGPAPYAWRLVTLDAYDGVQWSDGETFSPTGAALPDPHPATLSASSIAQHVVVRGLRGPWIPAADHPVFVSDADARVDAAGNLYLDGGLHSNAHVDVTSTALSIPAARESSAIAATGAQYARELQLDMPPKSAGAITSLAHEITDNQSGTWAKLVALQKYLQDGTLFRPDKGAQAGEFAAKMQAFLVSPSGSPPSPGGPEQFVSAFALMARAIGVPARVAVGFHATPDGHQEVRSHDAIAWDEVALDGLGWVPIQPMKGAPAPQSSVDLNRLKGTAGAAAGAQSPAAATPRSGPIVGRPAAKARGHRSALPILLLSWLALVLLVALAIASVPLLKRRQRARRRASPEPRDRIVGAWHEVLDRLDEAGVRPVERLTTADVVSASAARFGDDTATQAGAVGTLADVALFSLSETEPADADFAWSQADAFRSSVAGQHKRIARARAAMNPQALLRGSDRGGGRRRRRIEKVTVDR